MGESTAYGATFGCISRRIWLLGVFCALSVLCCTQVALWIFETEVWDMLAGNSIKEPHPPDCTGSACFEIFSCYGMKAATTHIREPLVSLTGAVLFPIGAIGAHHGRRWHLRLLVGYLLGLAVLRTGLIAGDLLYVDTCHMYPLNIIQETMVNWFPPSPVTNGAQGVLRGMADYPFDPVAKLTGGFPVLRWYVSWTSFVVLFLAFTAREAWLLARLVERGPLGLGPCYGLGQWDQVLDKEALMRIKGKDIRSKFVEDCTMIDARAEHWPRSEGPLDFSNLEEAMPIAGPFGGGGAYSYGAAAQRQAFQPASGDASPLYLQPTAEEQEADHELDGVSVWDDAEAEAAAAAAAAEEEERLGLRF